MSGTEGGFDDLTVATAGGTCPGDLDGDGDVDISDLAILLSNYVTASGATYEQGDLDSDGDVDINDLTAMLSYYGTDCD